MPEDYQDLVLATYKKKCEERKLHLNLLKPTTVKLKRECLKKYDASDEAKDVFSDFFDKDKMDNIALILSQADPGDFRALLNHINGITTRTDEKNSELLAWLIDFRPRPSISYYNSFDKRYNEETKKVIDNLDDKTDEMQIEVTVGNGNENHKNEGIIIVEADKQGDLVEEVKEPIVESTGISVTGQPIGIKEGKEETTKVDYTEPEYVRLFSPRYIVISCIILLFIGSSSFVAWENSTISVRMPNADEKCMYWNEDHYEPVKCDAQIANATIIPINIKKLQRQRKINLSDTLTSYSLGKVWYKGFVKDHEFFTDSGAYPQDIQRVLKPLTNTILTKYTSNYRYMLTRLVWFLCAAFLISLCGIWASKLKKEVKHFEEEAKTEKEEITAFRSNELQATSV